MPERIEGRSRMGTKAEDARDVVMDYIKALDHRLYDDAIKVIDDGVKIIGPAGETFGKPRDFTDMLKRFQGKYEIKRIFVDGDEVCLLYDFVMPESRVYMSSWYKVKDKRIVFIRTIFDPEAFNTERKK